MIQAPNLPAWAALLVGILMFSGAVFALVGAIGLVNLKTYYERVHATSLAATVGAVLILASSIVTFSVMQTRPVLHEVLIFIFVSITTPVTLMLLTRAAVYRDRIEGDTTVPRDYRPAPKEPPAP